MLSYRHAFHAANHADVLKHSLFLMALDYYKQKDTAFTVIDTHAGAGLYDLDHRCAQSTNEHLEGLARLQHDALQDVPELNRYLDTVAVLNKNASEHIYPGSPVLCATTLRTQDSLHVFELHPNDFTALTKNLAHVNRDSEASITCHHADGFTGAVKLLPPPSRRGIVLMDPSFEVKLDYEQCLNSIHKMLKRFPNCCVMLWYPLLARTEVTWLQGKLEALQQPWLHALLQVKAKSPKGMYGSGMFIINPPWVLRRRTSAVLQTLQQCLGQDHHAHAEVRQFNTD